VIDGKFSLDYIQKRQEIEDREALLLVKEELDKQTNLKSTRKVI